MSALTDKDHELIEAAAQAIRARYRYDWQEVGAAIRLRSGKIFAGASLDEKVRAMREPEMRARLLAEVDAALASMSQFLDPERAFPMGAVPDYEPARADSVAGRARALGIPVMEHYYDVLLGEEGRALLGLCTSDVVSRVGCRCSHRRILS